MRWVGITDRLRVPPPASGFSWASSMDTATRPACSIGEAMVDSGGLQKSAPKMSSQIQGKSEFQGTFNENAFCDAFDTRL